MLHSYQRTENLDGSKYDHGLFLDLFIKYTEPSPKTFGRVKYALKKISIEDRRIVEQSDPSPYTEYLLRLIDWRNHYFLAVLVELRRKINRDSSIHKKLYLLHRLTLGINNGYYIDPSEHHNVIRDVIERTDLSIHAFVIANFTYPEVKKIFKIYSGFRKNNILVAEEILDKIMIEIIRTASEDRKILDLEYIDLYRSIKALGERALLIQNLYNVTREFLTKNISTTKQI
ncbi:MAG: hypothetical protein NZ908_01040 [Candidatus Micrarchaeota archaeon]|nr:hypothetical protein [Candidatus Micrarchaeota archaeon]MCX8154782.1 hypothetical protein [Candidatus Micrarchaeota archaeon]